MNKFSVGKYLDSRDQIANEKILSGEIASGKILSGQIESGKILS